MIGASRLGRISRNMIRVFDAPRAREATTNSLSRSESTSPLTMRITYVQVKKPTRKSRSPTPGWITPSRQPLTEQAAPMPRPRSRSGSDSTTSVNRESAVSIQPR